jgi:hypothetical protein
MKQPEIKMREGEETTGDDLLMRQIDSLNAIYYSEVGKHPDTTKLERLPSISWEPDTTNTIHFSSRFSISMNVCPVVVSCYLKTDSLLLLSIGNRPGYFRCNAGMPSGLSLQCQLTKKMYLQMGCSFFQTEITLRDHQIRQNKELINTVVYDGKTVVKYKFSTFQIPITLSHYSTELYHSLYYSIGVKANFIYYEKMNYEMESNFNYVAGYPGPFYNVERSEKKNTSFRFYNLTPTVSIGGCYNPDSRISILYYGTFDSFPLFKNKDAFFHISALQFGMQNISIVYYF